MIATSGFLTALNCTKFVSGRGFAPDPAGGAYSALTDPLSGLWGPTFKGRKGRGGDAPMSRPTFLNVPTRRLCSLWPGRGNNYFAAVMACEVLWSACLSVCPLACLKNHMSKLNEIFCTCYLWLGSIFLWLQRNTLYFRFCEWRHVFTHSEASGTEWKTTLCFIEFDRWRHRERSLICTIALMGLGPTP